MYYKTSLKIPKGYLEVVDIRYQRILRIRRSKIPKGYLEVVDLRYQRDT